MNRKIAIILIALILALIAGYFIYKPDFGQKHEGLLLPENQNRQEETVQNEETAETPAADGSETKANPETTAKDSESAASVVKPVVKQTSSKKISTKQTQNDEKSVIKELKVEETHEIKIIDDDTDWSLLEKIPRSDIVVVDRVYKMKSPRKYFFK